MKPEPWQLEELEARLVGRGGCGPLCSSHPDDFPVVETSGQGISEEAW